MAAADEILALGVAQPGSIDVERGLWFVFHAQAFPERGFAQQMNQGNIKRRAANLLGVPYSSVPKRLSDAASSLTLARNICCNSDAAPVAAQSELLGRLQTLLQAAWPDGDAAVFVGTALQALRHRQQEAQELVDLVQGEAVVALQQAQAEMPVKLVEIDGVLRCMSHVSSVVLAPGSEYVRYVQVGNEARQVHGIIQDANAAINAWNQMHGDKPNLRAVVNEGYANFIAMNIILPSCDGPAAVRMRAVNDGMSARLCIADPAALAAVAANAARVEAAVAQDPTGPLAQVRAEVAGGGTTPSLLEQLQIQEAQERIKRARFEAEKAQLESQKARIEKDAAEDAAALQRDLGDQKHLNFKRDSTIEHHSAILEAARKFNLPNKVAAEQKLRDVLETMSMQTTSAPLPGAQTAADEEVVLTRLFEDKVIAGRFFGADENKARQYAQQNVSALGAQVRKAVDEAFPDERAAHASHRSVEGFRVVTWTYHSRHVPCIERAIDAFLAERAGRPLPPLRTPKKQAPRTDTRLTLPRSDGGLMPFLGGASSSSGPAPQ